MRFIPLQNPYSALLARTTLIIVLILAPASIFTFSQTGDVPPPNDNFRDAQLIGEESGSVQGELLGATVETNEPMIGKGMATVWYNWTAPANRSMTFRVGTETEPTVGIAVFQGEHLGKLSLLASGDVRDRVTMIVYEGMEYKIQASAKTADNLDMFYLTWNVNGAESWKQFDFDGPDNALGEPERGHGDFAIYRWWTVMSQGAPSWWIWSERAGSADVYMFGSIIGPMYYKAADYDGDEKSDIAVFYPETGLFWIFQSSNKTFRVENWGMMGDVPITGDFDGDDIADVAIWRAQDHNFWIKGSKDDSVFVVNWGISGDVPIPADYDGDGVTDIAIARNEESGQKRFYIRQSSDQAVIIQNFGLFGDFVLPGDFDSDGKADIAVFRTSDSSFHYLRSSDGNYFAAGLPSEFGPYEYVTAGDYFNGTASDLCAWRYHPQGILYCLPDGGIGSLVQFPFGHQGDAPIAGTALAGQ